MINITEMLFAAFLEKKYYSSFFLHLTVSSGFGIVFAMLTKLSLDIDDVIRLVRLCCSNCQRRMQACKGENSGGEAASYVSPPSTLFTCLTLDCPLSGQRFDPSDSNHVLVSLVSPSLPLPGSYEIVNFWLTCTFWGLETGLIPYSLGLERCVDIMGHTTCLCTQQGNF